jgi:hypothetical protein
MEKVSHSINLSLRESGRKLMTSWRDLAPLARLHPKYPRSKWVLRSISSMISVERRMEGGYCLLGKASFIWNYTAVSVHDSSWVEQMTDTQTYTSQTGIKKGNRDMETVLRDLEYFATLAALKDSKYQYPKYVLFFIETYTLVSGFTCQLT